MSDVVCVGILVADLVGIPVREYPKPGELVQVDRMELHVGGCASNTALALGKIGAKTALLGKVGQDPLGDFIIQALRHRSVDTTGIQRDPEVWTASTQVIVLPGGERSFIHYTGANARFTLKDIDFRVLKQNRILHVAGAYLMPALDGEPTAQLLSMARAEGLITCLDTAWDTSGRWLEILKPCLPYLDYFVPSYDEARQIAQRDEPEAIADLFLEEGVGTVALKMSLRGCFVKNARERFHVPAYQVDAVDELGAGDCFAAGFLTGLVHQWDLESTARFANAVGAMCVTELGATTGVASLDETFQFMKSHPLIEQV